MTEPVAIVGMSVLLPGAADLDAYWHNLMHGTDAISEVPSGRWDTDAYYREGSASGPAAADQVYCRRGGFVDTLAEVEVTRFGIMPNSASGTEPDQLIALRVAAEAIADAGGADRLPDRHRVGVVLGRGGYLTPGLVRLDQRVRTAGQLVRTLGELLPDLSSAQLDRVRRAFTDRLGPDRPESAIGLVPNLAASRVANRLDLRGPAYTVDAACASSLVAVDQAVAQLAAGRVDMMLAGGVHHCHDITLWSVFSQLRALSPSQRIRPFHRGADGILIGEGTGVVVLKRLADAERDGDRVYAVIRGTGVASDGRTSSLVNPDSAGQAQAVRQAWRAAGLDPTAPDAIGLLEAHGTATPAGDAAELATLAEVFGSADDSGDSGDRAVIGSVKSMIGHTMPAAGVAGLVKAALAVHHGMLLPTLHCEDPHPALAATRFRPLEKAAVWETSGVRRAAVNAFGFGGINAHVVLEEAPSASVSSVAGVVEPERVLVLAADSPERLAALLDADDPAVRDAGLDPTRPHVAAGPVRLGIVDPTAKRLALARRAVAKGRAWQGRNDVWLTPRPLLGSAGGGLAFVFPGLEGDFTPQVDDVAAHFGLRPVSSAARAQVADVGRHGLGVVSVGLLLDSALRRMGVVPDAVAGHSVGEWTAMVAAGVYAGDEVSAFMESFDPDEVTVPGLAFGAIGAPAERVLAALEDGGAAEAGVVLSHDNSPNQSMVCGPDEAVTEFVRSFRAEGVLSQVLPFRSGFHTPMLKPYLGPIESAAHRFRLHPPTVPLWSGTTASPYPQDPASVRELFVRHLLEPVRFRQLSEALYAAGHRTFVQVGTGQLGSLLGDTLGTRDHLIITANSPHRTGLAQLRRVATALWTAGAEIAPDLPPRASVTGGRSLSTPARRDRPPVRLDLSGGLVRLDQHDLTALRAELRARTLGAGATASSVGAATGGVAPSTGLRAGLMTHAPAAGTTTGASSPGASSEGIRLNTGLHAELGAHAPGAGTTAGASSPGAAAEGTRLNTDPHAGTGAHAPAASTATGAATEGIAHNTGPHAHTEAYAPAPNTTTRTPSTGATAPRTTAPHAGPGTHALGSGAQALTPNPVPQGERHRRQAAHPPAPPVTSVSPTLDALAPNSPIAAELSALLRDTANTVAELITAGAHRPPTGSPAPGAARAATTAARHPVDHNTGPHHAPPSSPAPGPSGPASVPRRAANNRPAGSPAADLRGPGTVPPQPTPKPPNTTPPQVTIPPRHQPPTHPHPTHGTTLRISPDTMPYLLDHCFFPQRPNWPDIADRWPVVPATTIVQLMMDAAEQAAPGMQATAVHGARFDRWLTATPPADVEVTVTPEGPNRLAVTFGPGARAVVELAPQHPPAPPRQSHPAPERAPDHTAAQLYAERWMFHGPAFQGVTELSGIGEAHVRGVITAPAAPGALLDNVGQILGYWIMATRTARTVVFPVQLKEIRFHGPHPRPGTEVHTLVRITALTDTTLEADVELTVGDTVWARLTGWQDRRFDNDPTTRPVERFPDRNTLSEARPSGWSLLHERWPDLASRDLIMRNSLSGAERSQYAEHAPRGRRQWLLGRIALKDAVRQWLWDHGEGPVYPAEIRVHNDDTGRPYVTGLHGRTLPALDVSLAHRAESAVAIVRAHTPGPGPGIDLEEVVERDRSTLTTVLGQAELRLLERLHATTGESEALWFTRFWAAKEAVAKAEGTGFEGRPRDFTVVEVIDDSALLVSGRLERAYPVRHETTRNPPTLPARDYVVAWTTGPQDETEEPAHR